VDCNQKPKESCGAKEVGKKMVDAEKSISGQYLAQYLADIEQRANERLESSER